MKALSVLLYSMGNMSYRMIANLLQISHVSVYKWIRSEAKKLPEPEVSGGVEVVMLDQVWHFIKKKQKSCGFGERMTLFSGELWPGFWVGVMMQPVEDSWIKLAFQEKLSSRTIGKDTRDSSLESNMSQEKT